MKREEEALKHKKEQLFAIKNKNGPKFENVRVKIMENAQKHGQYAAQLQVERENLQKKRMMVSKQLENNNLNDEHKTLILSNINHQSLDPFRQSYYCMSVILWHPMKRMGYGIALKDAIIS